MRLAQDGAATFAMDAGGVGAEEWCAGGDDFAAGTYGARFDGCRFEDSLCLESARCRLGFPEGASPSCGIADDLAGGDADKARATRAQAEGGDVRISVSFRFSPDEKVPVGTLSD